MGSCSLYRGHTLSAGAAWRMIVIDAHLVEIKRQQKTKHWKVFHPQFSWVSPLYIHAPDTKLLLAYMHTLPISISVCRTDLSHSHAPAHPVWWEAQSGAGNWACDHRLCLADNVPSTVNRDYTHHAVFTPIPNIWTSCVHVTDSITNPTAIRNLPINIAVVHMLSGH